MDDPKRNDKFSVLRATLISTESLIHNFEKTLETPNSPSIPTIPNPPNPLALLSDASSILKAQTTKLSLLILNKPFTPTAIVSILTSLSNTCLPALMSVFELCPPTQYSHLLNRSIRTLLFRAFGGLCSILTTIPRDEDNIDKPRNHGVLALTGALWETCDNMAELASTGLVSLAANKTDVYHGLLKDAIEELAEWDPDEDTEDDSCSSDVPVLTPDLSIDQSSETTRQGSKRPASTISLALANTLALLRHLQILYPALKKWRILAFPPITSQLPKRSADQTTNQNPFPSPSQISSFNTLINSLLEFSEKADEIADTLYAQDESETSKHLTRMKTFAAGVIGDVRLDWNMNEDRFSEWIDRWKAKLDKINVGEPAAMRKNEKNDPDNKTADVEGDVNTTSLPNNS